MENLQIFKNEEFGEIRTVTVNNEPWFVGKDIAEVLGVEECDRGVAEMETPSGKQNMTIINESGLYALIFGSKLESAKRFKHWVTMDLKLFEIKERTVNNPDGSVRITKTTKVTGKGQSYFINKFLVRKEVEQ